MRFSGTLRFLLFRNSNKLLSVEPGRSVPVLIDLIYRRGKNKGIGIEIAHYLGDGLYQADEL